MKWLKMGFNGLSFMFLYIIIVLIIPIVLLLLGVREFNQAPELLGMKLYVIQIKGETFSSEATILGLIISFTIACLIYIGITRLLVNKQEKSEEA